MSNLGYHASLARRDDLLREAGQWRRVKPQKPPRTPRKK
jgi:hypothetical protein